MDKQFYWLERCRQELEKSKDKKILMIGGASSAGKTYKCKLLKNYLESYGKSCFVVSMDNFYKGISKRIVEKTIKKHPKYQKFEKFIYKIVNKTTKDCVYAEKFSKDNQTTILTKLQKILDNKSAKEILDELMYCHKNINFDIPEAIDFDKILININSKKYLEIPTYSFKTSEVVETNKIDNQNYDYIIFEGIFALSDNIAKKIDDKNVLKIFLKSDNLTMFSRRLYRDIIKERRTRSPKETFESYFKQVMPCYFKYIAPTEKNADMCVFSTLTSEEILKKSSDIQENKYDYQIVDRLCENIKLYITESNNKPKNLVFEYIDTNQKKIEKYDLSGLLEQNNTKKVLKYFESCGFDIINIREKEDGIAKTL